MRHPTLAALIVLTLPILASAAAAAPTPDGDKCQGTLELGGKTYKLQYAVAYAHKVFDDQDAVSVLFSEAPIPVDKLRTSLRETGGTDKFFHFKPHVTVTFDKDGKPMFCNAYADNNSLSVSGTKLKGKLEVKDGKARGETSLSSDPDDKRKSSFKVSSFDLTLIVVPVEKKETKPETKPEKETEKPKDDAKGAIAYRDLPLPDGATDVEYKKIVEHIRCKSPADIRATAGSMTSKLADQGWKTVGTDLVGPKSAILKRTRGDASLTIFVKPPEGDEKGSTVQIMSKGLTWHDVETAK